MIRVIILFILLTLMTFGAIWGVKKLSGQQIIDLTRIGIYAIISSSVAVALMFILVEIF
jgi:hypothetical protein